MYTVKSLFVFCASVRLLRVILFLLFPQSYVFTLPQTQPWTFHFVASVYTCKSFPVIYFHFYCLFSFLLPFICCLFLFIPFISVLVLIFVFFIHVLSLIVFCFCFVFLVYFLVPYLYFCVCLWLSVL